MRTIEVFSDYEQLSQAAAECFVQESREAIAEKGSFNVVLSGGKTPKRTYQHLIEAPFLEKTDWRHITVFWGDERCVSPNDPESNERMAREALLNHVPIPEEQIYPMRCEGDPTQAAYSYEEKIQHFFDRQENPQFDLIFLGLGENGHTASLFPYQPVLSENSHWVSSVYETDHNLNRLTMTALLINKAKKIIFLVSGEEKATVLAQVLYGAYNPDALPAQLIQPLDGEILWLVDRAASVCIREANLLKEDAEEQLPHSSITNY